MYTNDFYQQASWLSITEKDFRHITDLPYHLASSSSAGATAAGLALAAFFLEKRATVLKAAGLEAVGADLATPRTLRGFPSISDTPSDAAALGAAREAIFVAGKKSKQRCQMMKWWLAGWLAGSGGCSGSGGEYSRWVGDMRDTIWLSWWM